MYTYLYICGMIHKNSLNKDTYQTINKDAWDWDYARLLIVWGTTTF